MTSRLVLMLCAAALLLPAAALPVSASPAIVALPNCQGATQVRPSSVIFACGDGGVYATGVRWLRWGGSEAVATATLHANDCTPNCAAGHFQTSAVYVIAAGIQRCRGMLAYAKAAYVPRARGIPSASARVDWFPYTCR